MFKENLTELLSFNSTDKSRDYYLSLNGIRGMAFLLVLLSHMCSPGGLFFQGIGIIGVWLFFVLSAFLLTNYFITAPQKTRSPLEWSNYFVRRFLRIYPLYFIVVTSFFSIGYIVKDTDTFLSHILLVQGLNHFWSIPAEMGFYLILPFVVFYILAVKANPVLSTVSLIALTIIQFVFFPPSAVELNSVNTLHYLPVFVAGSVLTTIQLHFLKNGVSKIMRHVFESIAFLVLGAIVFMFPSVMGLFVSDIPSNFLHHQSSLFGLLWAVFILSVLNGSGVLKKFFETRLLLFFGKISFSAYLIHPLIISGVFVLLPNNSLLSIALIVLLTIIAASISYILIERPCMKFSLLKRGATKSREGIRAAS